MKKSFLRIFGMATSFLLIFSNFGSAWQAVIDTSFGDGGITDFFNIGSGFFNRVRALVIQNDGKIIVGGSFTSYNGENIKHITRLNPDGSRDVSFMTGIGFEDEYYGYLIETIALQNDGKILIGGSFTSYNGQETNNIIRLNNNGSIDNSFIIGSGFNSSNNGSVRKIALQNDGKILVGGIFTSYNGISVNGLVRLNPDGSIDSSFNVGETFNNIYGYTDLSTITLQNDGKILIGGSFETPINNYYCVNKYQEEQPQYTTEESCLSAGYCYNKDCFIEGETEQSCIDNGNRRENSGFMWSQSTIKNLARLNSDGSIDTSFLPKNNLYKVNDINIQNDGKIIVGGFNETYIYTFSPFSVFADIAQNPNIFRLNPDGSIDNSFIAGEGFLKGYDTAIINKTIIQSDGKIIVIGDFLSYNGQGANSIARLNSDGSFDSSFNIGDGFGSNIGDGFIEDGGFGGYRIAYDIKLTNDGGFMVGGEFASYNKNEVNNIVKLNPDGSNNTNLNKNDIKGFDNTVHEIKTQDDGKILVGGEFSTYNEQSANGLIRLNANGSIDSSFDIGIGFDDLKGSAYITTIEIQDDDKILVGGRFTSYNGQPANGLIRLNANGSIDSSFDIGIGFDDGEGSAYITTIEIQDDDKILVGGRFTSYNGQPANGLIRLNTNGSIDTSFDIGDGFDDGYGYAYIYTTRIQDDDKILVGGRFNNYNTYYVNNIVRLNYDGSIDTSFDIGDGFDDEVYKIEIGKEGGILVGGYFTSYNRQPANGLIRLNANGSIDSSFDIGIGFDDGEGSAYITTIEIQDDDKILVGGRFNNYNTYYVNNIVRLNYDGSIDTSFDIGDGFDDEVYKIEIGKEGGILVGGYFTSYNKELINYISSLIGNTPVYLPNSNELLDIKNEFSKKGYNYQNIDFWGDTFFGDSKISLKETNGKIFRNLNIITDAGVLYLPENLEFKKSDNSNYTLTISPPSNYTGTTTVDSKPVLSAISVGSTTESLTLTNGAATLGMSVVGSTIGDPVSIYSSQDGSSWTYEKGGIVSDIDGQPYVSFTTDHFTYFAIAGSTGSFVINNDEASTTSQIVNLTISAPTATGMMFSNDGITWSGREVISTTKTWELSEGYEEKTVYAQFIANGEIYSTSDSILYGIVGDGTQGNLTLTITGGVTECVYGTSLDMNAQDVKIGIPYTFSGTFPSTWYCQDYQGIDGGWTLTIQTTDLTNEKGNTISGSNLLISHDTVVVQGDLACTGDVGTPIQFYSAPHVIFAKASESNKICKVSANDVSLLVNVPANQAPGSYSGTLTLTMNGF
ncbi:MAG: delta-60 repeat domain-containing protein [Candidatus Absconditabacteria bacterium]|nr:delta-60 repeat domain-containing protein [Candidatus Absconditabacteria bacterium]